MIGSRTRDLFTVGVVIALLGTAIWYSVRPRSVPVAFAGPTAEDLDTLSRYLQPLPPAPEVESYDMFIPATESLPPRFVPPATAEPPQPRRLSAILVIGSEPIAIIDDQQVRQGSILPGGTQVVDIDRTGVTLREPDGRQRTLRLSASANTTSE